MFETFDFAALDDPSFKEDAVREEILAPILREVGYRPSGPLRVQWSKALVHPFVMIGSQKHRVSIVPDYTLFADSTPLMVLDAKAPGQSVVKSRHVEQVYSYAIHPEVRCEHYGLCNGRELVVYSIHRWKPLFQISIKDVDSRWEEVLQYLHPKFLLMPDLRDFADDWGLHARRAGIKSHVALVFVGYYLQDINKVEENLYTSASSHEEGGRDFIVSFDYNSRILEQMLAAIPSDVSTRIRDQLTRQPFKIELEGKIRSTLRGTLGDLTEGVFEFFVPIKVSEVSDVVFDPDMRLERKDNGV